MMIVSHRLAPLRGPSRSARRSGRWRRITMAVAKIQAEVTAISAQAGHHSVSPAGQKRATPMKRTPRVSRMAKRAMSFLSMSPPIPRGCLTSRLSSGPDHARWIGSLFSVELLLIGLSGNHEVAKAVLMVLPFPARPLVDDEESRPCLGMRSVRLGVLRYLIAGAGLKDEAAAVFQLRHQLSFQDQQHMAAAAPVVRQVAGGVLHHAHSNVPHLERPPIGLARLTRVLGGRDRAPVHDAEGNLLNVHLFSPLPHDAKDNLCGYLVWTWDCSPQPRTHPARRPAPPPHRGP